MLVLPVVGEGVLCAQHIDIGVAARSNVSCSDARNEARPASMLLRAPATAASTRPAVQSGTLAAMAPTGPAVALALAVLAELCELAAEAPLFAAKPPCASTVGRPAARACGTLSSVLRKAARAAASWGLVS